MNQRNRDIRFNEKLHRYTDEDGNVYTSVTTLIGEYTPKFDEDFWARQKAKETGLPVSTIKANWAKIRDEACDHGNKIHKELEDSIVSSGNNENFKLGTKLVPYSISLQADTVVPIDVLRHSPLAKNYPIIFDELSGLIQRGAEVYAEKRVYLDEYKVAGTIDCPIFSPNGKDFIIFDWKTNKDELKFKSGYYKKVNGVKTNQWVDKKEYFDYPLVDLEHCKGNIYTMQLSLYAYILEQWGYTCKGLYLFHIKRDGSVSRHSLKYLPEHCEKLLNAFKKRSELSNNNNSSNIFGMK